MAVNPIIYHKVYERTKISHYNLLGNGLCFLCNSPLYKHENLLCSACVMDLPLNNKACPGCAIPAEDGVICASCLQSYIKPVQSAFCAFRYEYPVGQLIRHMKFHSRLDIALFFGVQMARRAIQQGIGLPECFIPVPLHPSRLAGRGFNQSLELARIIARETGASVDYKASIRARKTTAQTGLTAQQRRRNIKGVFKINRETLPQYQHVAIIDDVITTGSTAHEFASTLSRAGIEQIDVWACARASIV